MADSAQEKTEAATPRKLSQAREDGNVAKSTDLNAAASMLVAVFMTAMLARHMLDTSADLVAKVLGAEHTSNPTRIDDVVSTLLYTGKAFLLLFMPLALLLVLAGVIACVGQVGFMLTGKPLMPKFSKLNPLPGIKRLFDARAGIRLVMSLGKVAIIAGVAGWYIYADIWDIAALSQMDTQSLFVSSAMMVFMLSIRLAVLLLILALLDYWFQRFQQSKDLRMTKEEIKKEMKDMDGDPVMKQRRNQIARSLAMQRTAQAVPGADVIVTNPTHISIAIKYDKETMQAPKIVAKGADFMAMRIRQIATANDIPLVERKPLARALYANVKVGEEIPEDYYTAIAEILAYVYQLSGKITA